jgi:nucleoid-associated protein YgaU
MTEPREDAAAALPLAVTYAPDGRLAEAVHALVGRVGAVAGAPERATPFAAAVQEVVTWVTTHRADLAGDVAMTFEREGDRLRGDLRWTTHGAAVAPAVAGGDGVEVACDVDGHEVRCRISCPCA